MNHRNRIKILSMEVDLTNLDIAVERVIHLSRAKTGAYVCVSNVHMCMETFDSSNFCKVVNQADIVIPDGKPLSIAQILLGHKDAAQVRGQDIMNRLCAMSGKENINIGFYGGSSDTILELVKSNLLKQYSDINITYALSPPFRPLSNEEDKLVVSQINASNVDVLFVGIGCPKQENWMADHKDKLNCVMLGVGAAFDFIAGNKKHAPIWIQKFCLEWLFRLITEPRRLWRRYFEQNPRFVWHFILQLLKERKKSMVDNC